MTSAEIEQLQGHLSRAECYAGKIDGETSKALRQALASCPDPRPVLRIETGFHTAPILSIAVDAQCRYGVTGSQDKTVRIWEMKGGDLIRTQRLPIDWSGPGGVYGAVAMSQDGRLVAAAGKDTTIDIQSNAFDSNLKNGVYIFDRSKGTSITRIGAFENVVKAMTFSPDQNYLAIAIGAGNGVRIVDVGTGKIVASDRSFGKQDVYGLSYGPDGSLYVVGIDQFLRTYNKQFKLVRKVRVVGGRTPVAAAADPGGRYVAVAFDDTLNVSVYDAETLALVTSADTKGLSRGNFNVLAWSQDGARLYAAGNNMDSNHFRTVRIWEDAGRRVFKDVNKIPNGVLSFARCKDRIAFATGRPAFGLVSDDGKVESVSAHSTDMQSKLGNAFLVSSDGKRLRFGLDYGANTPVGFDFSQAALSDRGSEGLAKPDIESLPISDWENNPRPKLSGRPLPLDPFDVSRSLTILPSKSGFVIGSQFELTYFTARGARRWSLHSSSAVWGVNSARDGDLVLAARGDGTIRWHRGSDGRELLALFVNKDTRRWVAWTPTGYYMASPGGEDMIGWHINRGWEQAADFFPASKFRDAYNRPDIVQKVLDTLDEDEAVKDANAARGGKQAPAASIAERLPPVVSIVSPSDDATIDGDIVKIDYLVRSPSGLPVDGVEALVDGRPASSDRGLARLTESADAVKACLAETKGAGRAGTGPQGCRGSLTVRVPAGAREIGLFARTGDRAGDVAKIRVKSDVAKDEEVMKPRLYALVVGVSAYANKDYALGYAAKDAGDFAAALDRQKGGLYRDVVVRTLTDGQATERSIKDGLDWLTKQVTSRDVGVVYLAGHGMLDERDRFYFLAADSDATRLRATAVPREDISDALDSLAGKALLFLDACHSGAIAGESKRRGVIDINSVVNDFTRAERGVVAFTASTGRQVSQENAAWGNGAFTKALIEGLGLPGQKAGADYRGDGKITTSELDVYVTERVKSLTGGAQSPVMIRPATVPDFPLAVVR